jgi:hypothetical protein
MMHAFVILFSILLNGPILGVYLVYAQANIFMIVLSLVFYLFIPIPVMLIVSLLSWLIHQWSSRFVNKNIMQIVFMIMFLLGYLTISLGSFSEDLVAVFDPFIQLINAFYEPALWFQQGVATLDFLSIVLFLAFHGLAYGVFILVMNPLSRISNLDQLSARQSSQATSNTRYRKQSFFWSMFHKEWRYYFSIPIYFINTAFGLLLMLGGSIGLALFRNEVLTVLELPDLPIEWVVLIFFGLSISTVYTPAISLSLEGSNFSVLKSLPINGKTVMLSKVVFNIVLILGGMTNSDCEKKRRDKKPRLKDISVPPSLIPLVDVVLLLYRPEYYGFLQDEYGNSTAGRLEVIIAKDRNNEPFDLKVDCLFYDKPITT